MSPSSDTDRSGDPLWGLLVGCYVGLLGTPPVLFAVARLVTGDVAVLYGSAVASGTALTGLGWWVSARWGGLAVRLGATPSRWLAGVVPLPYALGGFASLSATDAIGVVAFFGGLGAMALGFVLGVMARTRHADAVLDGVETACEFRAGWPAAARRRAGFVVVAAVVLGSAGFLAGVLSERFVLRSAGQLLLPLGIAAYTATETREYTVSSAGLEQRLPVARRLWSWDAFDGYSRTDEAILLHRPWRVDHRFALADLDDPDAVETAVAAHLRAV